MPGWRSEASEAFQGGLWAGNRDDAGSDEGDVVAAGRRARKQKQSERPRVHHARTAGGKGSESSANAAKPWMWWDWELLPGWRWGGGHQRRRALLQCRYCDVAKDDEAHKNTRAAGAQDAGGNRGSSQAIVVSALRPGPAAPRRRQHTNARDTLRSRRGEAGVLVFLRPVFHRRQPTGGGQLRALPSRAPAGQRRERLVEKQSMPTCRMHPASHASGSLAVVSHIQLIISDFDPVLFLATSMSPVLFRQANTGTEFCCRR